MTVDEVLVRIEQIRGMKRDNEKAHIAEDELMFDVLDAIASGSCDDPQAVAAAATKVSEVDYHRWYA